MVIPVWRGLRPSSAEGHASDMAFARRFAQTMPHGFRTMLRIMGL